MIIRIARIKIMKKIISLFILSNFLIPYVNAADTGIKISGNLGAQILIEGNPESFIHEWNKPNPPKIRQLSQFTKYQTVSAFILFSGCTPIREKCDMYVKYSVTSPSGVVLQTNVLPLWQDTIKGTQLVLGKEHISQEIKKTDELGFYRVHATVVDKNSGDILELDSKYEVVKQLDD